jgi:hypothetical protein
MLSRRNSKGWGWMDWNEQIIDAIRRMCASPDRPREFVIFTAGTGIPDEMWVDYYKDINIPIITRDGTKWVKGVKVDA